MSSWHAHKQTYIIILLTVNYTCIIPHVKSTSIFHQSPFKDYPLSLDRVIGPYTLCYAKRQLKHPLAPISNYTAKHCTTFFVNKTNWCTEFQFYWYYSDTCFGQSFCPSTGILSCTSALVHFLQLWPFAARSRMELHPTPGSKRSQLQKMYQSRCTAENSWWWTCRVVIPIKLEFSHQLVLFTRNLLRWPYDRKIHCTTLHQNKLQWQRPSCYNYGQLMMSAITQQKNHTSFWTFKQCPPGFIWGGESTKHFLNDLFQHLTNMNWDFYYKATQRTRLWWYLPPLFGFHPG